MRVVHPFIRPSLIEGWSFGIGIMKTGSHIGVCYSQGQPTYFLHLAFHFDLRRESILSEKYGWIKCNGFLPEEAEDFANWIDEVWRKNGTKIPYGIDYWPGAHYIDGKFIPSETTGGLTCATFVMSLFDGYGTPLIDAPTWKERESDIDFQKWIVDQLDDNSTELVKKDPMIKQHLDQQKQHIGKAVRFRPSEVAFAASIWNYSLVTFEEAEAGGKKLEEELNKLNCNPEVA